MDVGDDIEDDMSDEDAKPGKPRVVRRQLGLKLLRLRKRSGKTREDIPADIMSVTKLWRIETGRTSVRPGDVRELAKLYDLPDHVTDELARLASGTKREGWYEEYGSALPEELQFYAGLESSASRIETYGPELVHGLLQTPDYARAVIRADDTLSDDVVKRRLGFRLKRQEIVLERSNPARLRCVMGAASLALVVGSEAIMSHQIEHLCALDSRDTVDVRILPWESGAHPWMRGAFALLLDFDDPYDPSIVHIETHVGAHYEEKPARLNQFRKAFESLYNRALPIERYVT